MQVVGRTGGGGAVYLGHETTDAGRFQCAAAIPRPEAKMVLLDMKKAPAIACRGHLHVNDGYRFCG